MGAKTGRRILWLALIVTVPVPFFMVDVGWVPTARLLLLAGVCAAAAVTEPGWDTGYVAGLLVSQALVATVLAYVVARLVSSALQSGLPPKWRRRAHVLVILLLFLLSLLPIYHTPLSSTRTPTNLFGAFR